MIGQCGTIRISHNGGVMNISMYCRGEVKLSRFSGVSLTKIQARQKGGHMYSYVLLLAGADLLLFSRGPNDWIKREIYYAIYIYISIETEKSGGIKGFVWKRGIYTIQCAWLVTPKLITHWEPIQRQIHSSLFPLYPQF